MKKVTFHKWAKKHDGKLRDAIWNSKRTKHELPKIDWSKIPSSLKKKFKKRGFKKHHFNIPNVRKLILDYIRETGYCM